MARAAAAAGRSVFPTVAGDLVHGLEKEGRPKPSHSAPGAPSRWRESARRTPTPARQARLLILPRDALTGTDYAGDPAPPAAGEGRLERNSLPSAKPSLGAACARGLTHTRTPIHSTPFPHSMLVMDEMVSVGSHFHVLRERCELVRQDFCCLFVFVNQHFTERGMEDQVPNSDFKGRDLCPVPQSKSKSR